MHPGKIKTRGEREDKAVHLGTTNHKSLPGHSCGLFRFFQGVRDHAPGSGKIILSSHNDVCPVWQRFSEGLHNRLIGFPPHDDRITLGGCGKMLNIGGEAPWELVHVSATTKGYPVIM